MEFLAAFPDADFDLSRYFPMETASADHGFQSQELAHYHHQDNNMISMAGGEVNQQSLFCQFVPMEMMNYSTTTTTTTNSSSNCSGNNSPLFDPAAHFTSHSYYDPSSTHFYNVEEANYNNTPMSTMSMFNNGSSTTTTTFPFEAPAMVPSSMEWQLKRKLDGLLESNEVPISPSDKKRPRGDVAVQKGGKRKTQKSSCNGSPNQEEEIMSSNNGQSSSSCNSEEEIMMNNNGSSQEYSTAGDQAQKSSRASRGSATDPQSLYARKRRERINERLRILQTLVPNGTKVDISTMLEEAVHYVKFLQLQIKLLSSDDLWMYAPIAYNGVDVGLNQKLSTLL